MATCTAKLHTDVLACRCHKCAAQQDGRLEVFCEVVDSRLEEDQCCEGYSYKHSVNQPWVDWDTKHGSLRHGASVWGGGGRGKVCKCVGRREKREGMVCK